MPKYSIIIPVYNTESYLKKCIDSVLNQTYKDYEIIIVNDGSTDNSKDIIEEYQNKYEFIKVINQDNQGLSMARNNGIKKSLGDYFLLLDSDDYIEKELLEKLDEEINKTPNLDLIRFQINNVKDKVIPYNEEEFHNVGGKEAFMRIVSYHYVENAWAYLYNKEYFTKNKFEFMKGIYHEDFALIPLVIEKAKVVSSINYLGYNYVERQNSIMTDTDYKKTLKKAEDFYTGYLYIMDNLDNSDHRVLKSYISNCLIDKIVKLNNTDYKKYLKRIKNDRVLDNVLANTLPRKIKKMIIKINPKLYYRR